MCGRYKLSAKNESVWAHFDIHGEMPFRFEPRYNIAPTQPIPVIRIPHVLEMIRWGLRLPNPKAGGINVRVESLAAPMYRDAIRQHRCLIPADGYYEWKVTSEPNAKKVIKQPFIVRRHDGESFAVAGLWLEHVTPDGELIPAAAILTTVPHGPAAEVHDRMPLILPRDSESAWLDPTSKYRDLLAPDWSTLEIQAVPTLVNSPKNEGPELIASVLS